LIALVRRPSPEIARCELSFIGRRPIDFALLTSQHEQYCAALARLGTDVRYLPDLPKHADGVFVEDTAVVLDNLAILARPGAESRRQEVASVESVLRGLVKRIVKIRAPGTLDGGDVMRAGKTLYVGLSTRTNAEGIRQLTDCTVQDGFTVRIVRVNGCLHLRTAVSVLGDGAVLANARWADLAPFSGYRVIPVAEGEPFAANSLRLGDELLYPAEHALTLEILRAEGFAPVTTPISELAKAEAGLTCLSLVFSA
jgi:dimethylargininase